MLQTLLNGLVILQNCYQFYFTKTVGLPMYLEKQIINPNLDLTEIIEKTENAFTGYPHAYMSLTSYVSGNCWLNSKISNSKNNGLRSINYLGITNPSSLNLNEVDLDIAKSLVQTVERVIPLSYPVLLLHGFEQLTNYNEKRFKVNSVITFPWILSKTPSFGIASRFAKTATQTSKYNQKFLLVEYEAGSKQIHMDIRFNDEEYEYLTSPNEQLKIIEIFKEFKFPYMYTFYYCKPV